MSSFVKWLYKKRGEIHRKGNANLRLHALESNRKDLMDGSSTFSNKLKEGMRKISMCRNNEMQVKVKVEHL